MAIEVKTTKFTTFRQLYNVITIKPLIKRVCKSLLFDSKLRPKHFQISTPANPKK
uniref:Uncharacterized protein n=1 Tax=Rhizophora mucronata TaxID=61149 RepID=A0A2P2PVM9_RHIMU